jgi:NAD+ synthase (glutamine-hydrolysing)
MAQINTVVGDFAGNAEQVLASVRAACEQVAEPVVVFPELTLSGYPPEDLLLRPSLSRRVETLRWRACSSQLPRAAWVIRRLPGGARWQACTTAPECCTTGSLVAEYRKRELPNYQVFDEKRYFTPADALRRGHPGASVVGLTYLRGYLGDGARGRRRRGRRRAADQSQCVALSPR